MKLVSLIVLSLMLVSCGKSGSSKTKERTKNMDQLNDTLKTLGVRVLKLPVGVSEYIVVSCDDAQTTDKTADNYDRAVALKAYKDAMNGMQEVEFGDGKRIDIWHVELAVSSAISLLETKLTEKACPEVILGEKKI